MDNSPIEDKSTTQICLSLPITPENNADIYKININQSDVKTLISLLIQSNNKLQITLNETDRLKKILQIEIDQIYRNQIQQIRTLDLRLADFYHAVFFGLESRFVGLNTMSSNMAEPNLIAFGNLGLRSILGNFFLNLLKDLIPGSNTLNCLANFTISAMCLSGNSYCIQSVYTKAQNICLQFGGLEGSRILIHTVAWKLIQRYKNQILLLPNETTKNNMTCAHELGLTAAIIIINYLLDYGINDNQPLNLQMVNALHNPPSVSMKLNQKISTYFNENVVTIKSGEVKHSVPYYKFFNQSGFRVQNETGDYRYYYSQGIQFPEIYGFRETTFHELSEFSENNELSQIKFPKAFSYHTLDTHHNREITEFLKNKNDDSCHRENLAQGFLRMLKKDSKIWDSLTVTIKHMTPIHCKIHLDMNKTDLCKLHTNLMKLYSDFNNSLLKNGVKDKKTLKLEQSLLQVLSQEKSCRLFINLCLKDRLYLDPYSIYLYAKENTFNLFIWETNPQYGYVIHDQSIPYYDAQNKHTMHLVLDKEDMKHEVDFNLVSKEEFNHFTDSSVNMICDEKLAGEWVSVEKSDARLSQNIYSFLQRQGRGEPSLSQLDNNNLHHKS